MYSTFKIANPEGAMCTNLTLKKLGTLQGVFGAEIDRYGQQIEVSHTEEINKEAIAKILQENGYQLLDEKHEK